MKGWLYYHAKTPGNARIIKTTPKNQEKVATFYHKLLSSRKSHSSKFNRKLGTSGRRSPFRTRSSYQVIFNISHKIFYLLLFNFSNKNPEATSGKTKRKFSTFFKSLVIELDKELYGPDNHLVEWHRQANTQETDGFQVKRPGS